MDNLAILTPFDLDLRDLATPSLAKFEAQPQGGLSQPFLLCSGGGGGVSVAMCTVSVVVCGVFCVWGVCICCVLCILSVHVCGMCVVWVGVV